MTTTWVLLFLVVDVAVLLSHRQLASLRTWPTALGATLVAVGLVALLTYWGEVEFGVYAAVYPDGCSTALGVTPAQADAMGGVRVRDHFFPPSVECGVGGRFVVLTPASTTSAWARVWVAGWGALGVGSLLLAVGRLRGRQPIVRRARSSSGQGVGAPPSSQT